MDELYTLATSVDSCELTSEELVHLCEHHYSEGAEVHDYLMVRFSSLVISMHPHTERATGQLGA
jgi:hypothetical protein